MFTAGKVAFRSRDALRKHCNGDHAMPQADSAGTKLVLVDHSGLGRVRVDMEAFFEFSFWMAEELEDLTAKWVPLAAPNASRDVNVSLNDGRG